MSTAAVTRSLSPVLLSAAATLLLTACGGSGDSPQSAGGGRAPAAAARTEKAAPSRPEDELPAARCPSTAGAGLPGPDIVGLKLGMGFDEALNHARCAMPEGVFGFTPRWFQQMRTGSVQLEKQAFTIQRGDTSECVFKNIGDAQKCGLGRRVWDHVDELIFVASPGINGRQTVVGIWRQQNWKPGAMPSREAVLAALRDKYGREGEFQPDQQYGTISWRYDTAGQPLSKSDELFQQCYGIQARPANQSWREGCGLSISADIVPPRDNPELVQSLYVGMVHQENLLNYGDAMQAELDRIDAERRASEVEQASGTAPTL